MAKSPVTAIEVRFRPADGGPGDDDGAWQLRRFAPSGEAIRLTGLTRSSAYEVQARNIGEGSLASAWVPVSITVAATATVPLSQRAVELDIEGGQIALDCTFRNFRLTLGASVTDVVFSNVPQACAIVLEIEQWSGGGNTIAYPPRVVPVAGVPHAMSTPAGATDIVTLQTTNGGVTWYQTVFQAGVAYAGTISPSPATGTVTYAGTPNAPSVSVTMATANGTGAETFAWVRDDSGGTDFLIDNATIAVPTFSIASGSVAYSATQRWRCTSADSGGHVCQATVNLTLARTVAGGVTIALAPDPASDLAVYPSQPVATVTATITGAPTSLVWSRIDANGGSNFLVGDAGGGDFEFRLPGTGSLAVTREQAWRLTDAGSGVFDDVTVELTRDV